VRLLPWIQQAARREPDSFVLLTDCEACMQQNSEIVRQSMRCGFLPDAPADAPFPSEAWQPPTAPDDGPYAYDGPKAEVCIGYTITLPEVLEVTEARAHWKHGELASFCEGERPTAALMQLILLLEASSSYADAYTSTLSSSAAATNPHEQSLFHRQEMIDGG
jgi:hypothetical protein